MSTRLLRSGLGSAFVVLALVGCGGDPAPADGGGGTDAGPPVDAAHPDDAASPDGGGGDDGGSMDGGGDVDSGMVGTDGGVPTDASDPVPAFRTPHPEIADADLATQALRIMGSSAAGATRPMCAECHTLSRERIRYWRALSDTSMSSCLTDLAVSSDASATAMLDCLQDPSTGEYDVTRLGVWASAARLAWFQYVFRHGVPGDWMTAHATFVDTAGMPQTGSTPLTQDEFDIVAEWFLRGVPGVDAVLPPDGRPTTCLPGVTSAMVSHVTDMATMGWQARNAADGMLMYGCAGATSAEGCMATETLASTTAYGANWENVSDGVAGAHLRVLWTTTYETAWWTRASVDGRFVSHGAATSPRLRFIDLVRDTVIGGAALYDPAWFPDGSGFIVQTSGGARICEQSVLTTGTPTSLTFTEPGCSSGSGIGLYEHVGTSLDGGDYWAIAGTATYDNGGHSPTLSDPITDWDATARSTVTFMTNSGTSFSRAGTTNIAHPYEGDAVLSHSLRLLITRFGGAAGPLGYVVRRLDVSGTGASRTISATEIARYCGSGAKPEVSFDERFLVYHHYVGDADAVELGFSGPSDPGFAAYRSRGAANVYMVDMTTGARVRITNMGPGQYALFPHFRSDGWLAFIVRDEATTPEHVVVSDAALLY